MSLRDQPCRVNSIPNGGRSLLIRWLCLCFVSFFFSTIMRAQAVPSQPLTRGTWEVGAFAGGGSGLFGASGEQYVVAGVRVGRVLSREHLHGWARGNFEYAGDFMPLFEVYQGGKAVYGGNFTPIMLKWNFTRSRKIVPYLLLSGGGLVTTSNVPPGDTSDFNFVGGGSAGVQLFVRPRSALIWETRWVHISNAFLGRYNPQLVSNFLFTVGYSWFP
jgi:lipid A 3-O-deacylase